MCSEKIPQRYLRTSTVIGIAGYSACCVLILSVLLASASRVLSAPGDLDVTFGTDGTVVTDFDGNHDAAYAIAVQSDGKLVVAGQTLSTNANPPYLNTGDFAIARYTIRGDLDTTFGVNGRVRTDFSGGDDRAWGAVIQPDGKIVVVGSAQRSSNDVVFAIARYTAEGGLDPTFDSDGKLTTDVDPWSNHESASAVAIQADGKIVVVGGGAIVRYNSDGSLDSTFGGADNGIVIMESGSAAVAIQPDGQIVVAGTSNWAFALARLNSRGFMVGSTTTQLGCLCDPYFGGSAAHALLLQSDGKIVLAGSAAVTYSTGVDIALARYNSDGSLDATFNGNGTVTTDLGNSSNTDIGYAIAIQADHKLIVAGVTSGSNVNYDMTLVRYNPDGSLDASFGEGGKAVVDFGGIGDDGRAVIIQSDGRIVMAGQGKDYPDADFAVARFISQDLILTQEVDDVSPALGQRITYTLMLRNNGPITVTDAALSDNLPAGLMPAGPITLDPPTVGTTGGFPTLVSDMTILVGQIVTVTFPVTASTDLVAGARLVNTVSVTSAVTPTPITVSVVITTMSPPIPTNDVVLIAKNTSASINVLNNDYDPNGDPMFIETVSIPASGTASVEGATIIYTPTLDFVGMDTFNYTVSDGLLSAAATVKVIIAEEVLEIYMPVVRR